MKFFESLFCEKLERDCSALIKKNNTNDRKYTKRAIGIFNNTKH